MCTGVCFAMLEPYYTILDTVCPPPLWEALQGAPFPDQQVQEQLHPCGCLSPPAPCLVLVGGFSGHGVCCSCPAVPFPVTPVVSYWSPPHWSCSPVVPLSPSLV